MFKVKFPTIILGAFSLFLSIIAGAESHKPQNIIFLIGDGMGPAYTTAYRYYVDDPNTHIVETTIFDQLLVGSASTYPDDETVVTDSAAAATALATGTKTYNGAIGVDKHKQPLNSILKFAKLNGYNTGIVVTSELNHATPASFVAHSSSRRNKDQIAKQFLTNKINDKPIVDLLLGGGKKYFEKSLTIGRKTKPIITWFKKSGYQYVSSLEELKEVKTIPAIGVFAKKGLPSALGSPTPFRLEKMTSKALELLGDSDKPFFLLVEASQIDWCGHGNDIACAMAEMDDFAATLKTVKQFTEKNEDTLMIATADHSTGGLSLGYNKVYQWNANAVKAIRATIDVIVSDLLDSKDIQKDWKKNIDFALNENEERLLESVVNDKDNLKNAILHIVATRTSTGWTTKGHDAVDVQVFAFGHSSQLFSGHQDNTQISNKLNELIKKGSSHE